MESKTLDPAENSSIFFCDPQNKESQVWVGLRVSPFSFFYVNLPFRNSYLTLCYCTNLLLCSLKLISFTVSYKHDLAGKAIKKNTFP